MKKMGLSAVYPKQKLSKKDSAYPKDPYLLNNIEIAPPNHVWTTDMTYIRHQQESYTLLQFSTGSVVTFYLGD